MRWRHLLVGDYNAACGHISIVTTSDTASFKELINCFDQLIVKYNLGKVRGKKILKCHNWLKHCKTFGSTRGRVLAWLIDNNGWPPVVYWTTHECHVTARSRALARAPAGSVIFRVVSVASGSRSTPVASWHSRGGGEVRSVRLSLSSRPPVCLADRVAPN